MFSKMKFKISLLCWSVFAEKTWKWFCRHMYTKMNIKKTSSLELFKTDFLAIRLGKKFLLKIVIGPGISWPQRGSVNHQMRKNNFWGRLRSQNIISEFFENKIFSYSRICWVNSCSQKWKFQIKTKFWDVKF